jgi:hypothetical protein
MFLFNFIFGAIKAQIKFYITIAAIAIFFLISYGYDTGPLLANAKVMFADVAKNLNIDLSNIDLSKITKNFDMKQITDTIQQTLNGVKK